VTTPPSLEKRIHDAIEGSDTDELIRIIDGHCAARNWDALVGLRTLLAEALTRGRQLWGVDQHIRYRLALEGPPELAARAVIEGQARFALGPLTEVVANRHTFADLEHFLPGSPERALIGHERALAGEIIDPDSIDQTVVELPIAISSWEPTYPRPEYKADRVESHPPDLPSMEIVLLPAEATSIDDPDTTTALLGLVTPWVEESNGRAQVSAVEGEAAEAIRALGPTQVRLAPISPDLAIASMAWAAGSGGAQGRRRGGVAGRLAAWWTIAALSGLDWPPDPDELGGAAAELQWLAWSDLAAPTGWNLNLAIEDPIEGLSWAITAVDAI
jgi:hypothetical protein